MYRTYSPKTSLRQTPNAILRAYFKKKAFTLKGVNFDELGETNIDPIMQAIDGLPHDIQTKVEADFRAVSEMACAAGTWAILEEAAFHKKLWADAFEAMRNHYERAFWTFLNEPEIFDVAACFTEMDSLGSWRRRFVGRNLKPAIEPAALSALAKGISAHYAKEGRGHHCKVDNYLRQNPERHCYFVYPEDYATTDMEVDDKGDFQERPRKPTFEIVFVYRPEEGLLEVSASGRKEQVERLLEVFGQIILGLDRLPDENREPAFDLSGLRNRDFEFKVEVADGIESVTVRQLRLDLPGATGRRIILQANASPQRPKALYDLIDAALDKRNVPLDSVTISQAKLRIVFAPRHGQQAKTLTFEISFPDRCTLKDDPHDQVAKKYLRLWKLARERDS